MRVLLSVLCIFAVGCARLDVYYPPSAVSYDGKGGGDILGRNHNRAVVLNGTDSLGSTVIDVHASGVRLSSAGGFDNSTSTRIVTREVGSIARWGIGWGFSWAILKSFFGNASSAYNSHQATQAVKAANAPKAAPLPAAGSTINAVTPATVVPVQ